MVLFRHPEVAGRPCSSCKKWVYDESGRIEKRQGKPVKRTGPPPCWKCPKKSPEQAHNYELSKANMELYNLYCKVKATSGACLTEEQKANEWLSARLALIDSIAEQDKRDKLAQQMSNILRAAAHE